MSVAAMSAIKNGFDIHDVISLTEVQFSRKKETPLSLKWSWQAWG